MEKSTIFFDFINIFIYNYFVLSHINSMWYKRIYKYLRLFLIIYPLFYWFFIVRALCEDGWCYADSDFIPSMAKFFAITYIIGIIVILGLFWIYTLFLLWNKILYKIKQFIKKIKTFLKIKKKKIWKYPIIIQYSSPKWLTPYGSIIFI